MGKVVADITMSLDGFITGPDVSMEDPMGIDGDRLHEWMFDLEGWRETHGLEGGEINQDSEIAKDMFKNKGAVLMGRRMFDLGEQPWGDPPPFHMPVFVVTHRERETQVKQGGTSYIFVTDGLESALRQAKAAAGEKDVIVQGGANIIQQLIKAKLLDELHVHVAPVLFGEGTRLFEGMGTDQIELEIDRVVDSPRVTHLRYQFAK